MPIITPSGKFMGRKPDRSDVRDKKYGVVHADEKKATLPRTVDLRSKLPRCFDQGKTSSCGANMGSAMMCFLYPDAAKQFGAFSRMQIYYDVRAIEGDIAQDDGVETRDVFKTLADTGAAPEADWPFDPARMFDRPGLLVYDDAKNYKIKSFSRLQTSYDVLSCLAAGFPVGLGFDVPETLDSDLVARTGVLPLPGRDTKIIGGHDVLIVGYDLDFKLNSEFLNSGISSDQVADAALLVRNSWGTEWAHRMRGHFYMPMLTAMQDNDAWTARI